MKKLKNIIRNFWRTLVYPDRIYTMNNRIYTNHEQLLREYVEKFKNNPQFGEVDHPTANHSKNS